MVIIFCLQSPWQREMPHRRWQSSETTYFVYRLGMIKCFHREVYRSPFVWPTLDVASPSSFQEPSRLLYAGSVLKRRHRFLNDLSISSPDTLLFPAVTAKLFASCSDSSSMSARTVDRMTSAFFDMMYVRSVCWERHFVGLHIEIWNVSVIYGSDFSGGFGIGKWRKGVDVNVCSTGSGFPVGDIFACTVYDRGGLRIRVAKPRWCDGFTSIFLIFLLIFSWSWETWVGVISRTLGK